MKVIPHSGTYVSQISYAGAEEGFMIRRALEVEGVHHAALRASEAPESLAELDRITANMRDLLERGGHCTYIFEDDALHNAIARISSMSRLWKFVSMAKVDLDRMRQISVFVPGHLERVTEQHLQIVEAILRGKPDQAELVMRVQLGSSFDVMAEVEGIAVRGPVPRGHKIALSDIGQGEAVLKYGQVIGFATAPIVAGEHVHTQNLGIGECMRDYAFCVDAQPVPNVETPATFEGYARADGRIGLTHGGGGAFNTKTER